MAKNKAHDSIVGLDVGRSGVKIAFVFQGETKTFFFPSVVMPAKNLTFDTNPAQTQENTVTVDGQQYFVGETAIMQGAVNTVGLSSNWLEGVEHRALLVRAQGLLKSYGIIPKLIVAGLPINTFSSNAELLFKQVHEIFKCNVVPVPQPWGVYIDTLYNSDGTIPKQDLGLLQQKFAVIDVGHFTTDILLMDKGNWIEESSGSTVGMYKAITELESMLAKNGKFATSLECQNILKTGFIREFGTNTSVVELIGQAIPQTVAAVAQEARNLLDKQARSIERIIVAGGGAHIVAPTLKKLWPQVTIAAEPRFSVVLGMRKYGIDMAQKQPDVLN